MPRRSPAAVSPSIAPSPERRSARERLLAAADALFYEGGIHTVGIDRVIEHAGVAKASLYDSFGSKDELIRAYLLGRHAAWRARVEARMAEAPGPRERLLAVFDAVAARCEESSFRGCPFVRASAELRPGTAVKEVCDVSRGWVRGVFTEAAAAAGAAEPAALAHQLVLLYDGVLVSAQMDGPPGAAQAARRAAEQLLAQALPVAPA